MPGRDFLELARELLASGRKPRHWRGVIIHAYYALLLEARDFMTRWGLPVPPRQSVHSTVRLRLLTATNPDLKAVGRVLEELGRRRNSASYDLRPLPLFSSAKIAQESVKEAANALALLDAIDGDPVRRAAAIASIKP